MKVLNTHVKQLTLIVPPPSLSPPLPSPHPPPPLVQGEQGASECTQSLQTLFSVLYTMTRMMAPYTPFLTEHMFQNLRHLLPWTLSNENASIHYIMLPKPRCRVQQPILLVSSLNFFMIYTHVAIDTLIGGSAPIISIGYALAIVSCTYTRSPTLLHLHCN